MSKKEFDGVELKATIRAQWIEETERLGEKEARRVQGERARRAPVLGEFIVRRAAHPRLSR